MVDVVAHCEPYLRAEGDFWTTMDKRDAYVRPVEGSCNSMLPHFKAGNEYSTHGEVAVVDAELREAMRKVDALRTQRAKLVVAE